MMHNFDPPSEVFRILSVLVFAAALVYSASAVAQDGPTKRLFMMPTQSVNNSTSSIIPDRIGEQTRRAVGQNSSVNLMPTFESIRSGLMAQGQSSAAVAEAEELYTSGIGLLAAGDPAKASESFQLAVDIMENNVPDISNFDVLADALSNLALAYHEAGFDLDARKNMKQFAQLRPDATLDPDKYNEELIGIYEDEAAKVKKGGPGKLKIDASIEGATVFIDGDEKGATPLTVEDVGFGHHYLVVRSPTGGAVWSEKIRVRGRDREQEFTAELGEVAEDAVAEDDSLPTFYRQLIETAATGRFGTDLEPYLKELVTQTGAEFVVWILMYKEGTTYRAAPFAYRASDAMIVQGDGTSFDIELSNLRAGISELSKTVVGLVTNFPEDSAITTVEIGPAPAGSVVKAPEPEETETSATAAAVTAPPSNADASVAKTTETPPSESNTWTYIAAGGAVLVVGALIAGTVFLLSDDDNPDRASGFRTSVSW